MAARTQDLRHRVAQQVIAHVAQVERLVGVGRRIFDHDRTARIGSLAEAGFGLRLGETRAPEGTRQLEVQEAFHHVERLHFGCVGHDVPADLLSGGFGRLAAAAQQREGHQRIVALELASRLLNLQLLAVERPVKRLHSPAHHIRNKVFRPDHILRFLCANLTLFAELSTRHTENLRSGAAVSGFGITI